MPVTQMAPPAKGVVIFAFEPAYTPEGHYRVKMWRALESGDGARFGLSDTEAKVFDAGASNLNSIVVNCREDLLTTLPIFEEEAENLFTEITRSDFTVGLYNTKNTSQFISIESDFSSPLSIVFGSNADERFCWRYIKTSEATQLYGQWEFLPTGETEYDEAVVGQAQNAIEGTDHRWINREINNPYLDENANPPDDAEQIFDFKFVHVTHSGMEKVPVMPETGENAVAGDTWYMPVWIINGGVPGNIQENPTYDCIPCISNAITTISTSFPNAGKKINPRWKAYIDAYYWLKLGFDYAYGEGKWKFTCEDSPFEFNGARMTPTVELGNTSGTIEQKPSANWRKVRVDIPRQLFLPQWLWNAFKDSVNINVAPLPESMWPTYLQTFWDSVWEFCICFGWIPEVWNDADGIANIHFKDRTLPYDVKFASTVPVSAKPQAYPESENGISIGGLKAFLNGRANDGWYDDILAYKYGGSSAPEDIIQAKLGKPMATVINPMANPYVVPATAKSPAKFLELLRFGGYEWACDPSGNTPDQVHLYGTDSSVIHPDMSFGMRFPTFAPLIPGDDDPPLIDAIHNFDLQPVPPGIWVDTGPGAVNQTISAPLLDYQPIMRGRFSYVDIEGNTNTVVCDALRQLLARAYGTFFIKSSRKYSTTDPTINKYWLLDANGNRVGKPSWRNLRLFRQRQFPDSHSYFVKRRTMDPNTMSTSTESLRVESPNSTFIGGDFDDDTQTRGKLPGAPPNDGGGPTGGG